MMVEPRAPGNHVYSIVRIPRLGLPILGTLADRRGIEIRVVIEEMTPGETDRFTDADLLCISTITSTAPGAYRLADRARAAGVPVVMGGPHVTFLPDEALDHADWVIRGEAENSFDKLLDMLGNGSGPETVPGLSYRRDGENVHNPIGPGPADLDSVPIPDFSLLAGNGRGRFDFDRGVIPIQTSRGCPHRCVFCSVTSMFGHKLRFASCEHVAEELQQRRGYGKEVFFYDDNFCASPERAKSLLDHLLTRNIYLPPWLAQVSVRAANDLEMLRLMQRSNCRTVFVGFESIDAGSLAQYEKRQTVEDIRRAIRRFRRHDIWVHGMFVFGSDADRLDTIRATTRFANTEDIDTIQYVVLTPLPGTPLFEQMDTTGRLLTRDWSLYDVHHAVFEPAGMSPGELMTGTMQGMARFYSPGRILRQAARGKFRRAVFYLYARRQVKRWMKENEELLR
jgi:anaerobic magnesium-protoporphyrin IX monomethyl ester cyclase